ncbi:MAG: hypothetical protein ACJAYB_003560, partial [Psychromonas sp.]
QCVINFQYDQKSLLLSDGLAWCGSDYAATVDEAAFKNSEH